MNRRPLALVTAVVAAAAMTVPAASLAADGPTATAKPGGAHAGAVLRRIERRLDRRFQVFSARCLVANAPDACSTAAGRLVTHLGKLQGRLEQLKSKITEACAAANAPPRCANAAGATGRIDALLATIASDVAAVEAHYPNAGAATT